MKKPLTFICRQKLNFILLVFCEILQRHCKLVVLGNWAYLAKYTHKKIVPNEPLSFICRQKNSMNWTELNSFISCWQKIVQYIHTFVLHVFREILQTLLILEHCKLLVLGILGMLAYATQSDTINLLKTFAVICRQKINLILHAFLEILQRYAKFLFWILWASLITHTQNDIVNL